MRFGGQEVMTVFDNVFVPHERIFMNGEVDQSGKLVERFAAYHRQSYGGCKVGVGDVLIGATALIARMNGVENAGHIREKLVDMIHLNETLFCAGIACSALGHQTEAGNYEIDMLLANVCKLNVTRFPCEIARNAIDIAGGLIATMPSADDLADETTGPYIRKYLAASSDLRRGRPHEGPALHREHHDGRRGRGLPRRIGARRGPAGGAADHDRASGRRRGQDRAWRSGSSASPSQSIDSPSRKPFAFAL